MLNRFHCSRLGLRLGQGDSGEIPHSTSRTLNPALCIPHTTSRTPHPALLIPHSASRTPRPALVTAPLEPEREPIPSCPPRAPPCGALHHHPSSSPRLIDCRVRYGATQTPFVASLFGGRLATYSRALSSTRSWLSRSSSPSMPVRPALFKPWKGGHTEERASLTPRVGVADGGTSERGSSRRDAPPLWCSQGGAAAAARTRRAACGRCGGSSGGGERSSCVWPGRCACR